MMQRIASPASQQHGERRKTRDLHSTRHSCTLVPFAESRPGTEQNLRAPRRAGPVGEHLGDRMGARGFLA
ncbi:MAG TPA: hypothetical protein VK937_08835 [Candidatus Limnocylindria bacterium]|nr:hypothetical protein [Candidatus Limnocylindria bacterium]